MATFLSAQTVRAAVDRLAVSTANSSLADYLIFKRALLLARQQVPKGKEPPSSVVTGMKSEPFMEAVQELTLDIPPDQLATAKGHPYYSPFGASRDSGRGYKSVKYPSNGASDTASRWQSRGSRPLVLVEGTSPKEFRFENRTKDELEDFFNAKSAQEHFSGDKPRLLDVAVWWFRSTDLEKRFGESPSAQQLIDAFTKDLDLTELEVSAFFKAFAPEEAEEAAKPNNT